MGTMVLSCMDDSDGAALVDVEARYMPRRMAARRFVNIVVFALMKNV